MSTFLNRLNLLIPYSYELGCDRQHFISNLQAIVHPGNFGIFAMSFEGFSGVDKEYTGYVESHGFKFRKRRKLFDINMNFAVVEGTCFDQGDKLVVSGTINGFSPIFYPYYIFLAIFYTIFLIAFIASNGFGNTGNFPFLPFILLHAAFMIGLPYIFMRSSVKRMNRELEREFHFLSKQ